MRTSIFTGLFLVLSACGGNSEPSDTNDDPGQNGSGSAVSSGASTGSGGNNDLPMTPGGNGTETSLINEIEADVVGSYVFEMRSAAMLNLPILGETEMISTVVGIATLARDGDQFILTESGCHVDTDAGSSVMTSIPDVVPTTTEPTVSLMSFERVDGQIVFDRAASTSLLGVKLNKPETDPLPSDANDPQVFDQDGDGNPGVTVEISGLFSGSLYVIRREQAQYYDGLLNESGQLDGLVKATSEQVQLGATNPLLMQDMPMEPHPDPSASRVRLRRVAEPYDCARAVAEAPTLFP